MMSVLASILGMRVMLGKMSAQPGHQCMLGLKTRMPTDYMRSVRLHAALQHYLMQCDTAINWTLTTVQPSEACRVFLLPSLIPCWRSVSAHIQ